MNNKITYCQKSKEKLLDWAKEYYENKKEKLWERARSKYRELSNEEKNKSQKN